MLAVAKLGKYIILFTRVFPTLQLDKWKQEEISEELIFLTLEYSSEVSHTLRNKLTIEIVKMTME